MWVSFLIKKRKARRTGAPGTSTTFQTDREIKHRDRKKHLPEMREIESTLRENRVAQWESRHNDDRGHEWQVRPHEIRERVEA